MARNTRSPSSTSTGPTRPNRRQRAGTRASSPTSPPVAREPVEAPRVEQQRRLPLLGLGARVTGRALILVLVFVMLGLSYASSLRIYLNQQHELAVAEQEISDRSAQIDELESNLARWDDPAYVRAQARDRLGWVLPGETGYRVIGEDGKPIGDDVTIESEQKLPAGEHPTTWWERLWGSVETADAPVRKVTVR